MPATRVTIVTYERPRLVRKLLEDVERERPESLELQVWDDGSTCDYSEARAIVERLGGDWVAVRHHGKAEFSRLISATFAAAKESSADLYCWLQDDVRLCRGFFARLRSLWGQLDQPIALNLLRDSREECWTHIRAHDVGPARLTGWTDGIYATGREYLERLGWRAPTPSADWAARPDKSSGVYRLIAERLVADGCHIYQCSDSLVAHVGDESRMHQAARAKLPLHAVRYVDGEREHERLLRAARAPVVASMATYPPRVTSTLPLAVASILPQVDTLRVRCNSMRSAPDCLSVPHVEATVGEPDVGDGGKFALPWPAECYALTLDDDLIYPSDYVARITEAIDHYRRRAVVGYHGARLGQLDGHLRDYYRQRTSYHCSQALSQDLACHVLGTGVLGWWSSLGAPTLADCHSTHAADVWHALWARRARIQLVCLAHSHGWIQVVPAPAGETIYRRYQRQPELQADLARAINSAAPWPDLSRVQVARQRTHQTGATGQLTAQLAHVVAGARHGR